MPQIDANTKKYLDFLSKYKSMAKDVEENFSAPVKVLKVKENIPESFVELANTLVVIQQKQDAIFPKDLSDAELMKLKRLAQKYNISTKEAVSLLIDGENYISKEYADVLGILRLKAEIKNICETSANYNNSVPVNLLSSDIRAFLTNKRFNLSAKEMVEIFINEYLPEYSLVRVSSNEFHNKVTPSKKQALGKLEVALKELSRDFADEDGNIDSIFKPKNKQNLKKFISLLKECNITFDSAIEQAGLSYTKIYRLDPALACRQMLSCYHKKYGNFGDITQKDPFLRAKIETTQDALNIHNLNDLLVCLGFSPLAGEGFRGVSPNEIAAREERLIDDLILNFPNKVIPPAIYRTHEKISDEIIFLAKRKGYKYSDDYLKDIGFTRNSTQKQELANPKVLMTENDLLRYNFAREDTIKDFLPDAENLFNGELSSVENNSQTYSMLLFGERHLNSYKPDYRKNQKS